MQHIREYFEVRKSLLYYLYCFDIAIHLLLSMSLLSYFRYFKTVKDD